MLALKRLIRITRYNDHPYTSSTYFGAVRAVWYFITRCGNYFVTWYGVSWRTRCARCARCGFSWHRRFPDSAEITVKLRGISWALKMSVPLLSNFETDFVAMLPFKLQTVVKVFQICLTELLFLSNTTSTVLWPLEFVLDYPGEPLPER